MPLITGTVYKNASIPLRGFRYVWAPITPQKCAAFCVIEAAGIRVLHLEVEGLCSGVSRCVHACHSWYPGALVRRPGMTETGV